MQYNASSTADRFLPKREPDPAVCLISDHENRTNRWKSPIVLLTAPDALLPLVEKRKFGVSQVDGFRRSKSRKVEECENLAINKLGSPTVLFSHFLQRQTTDVTKGSHFG